MSAGYDIVAFVHDEVVIELPPDTLPHAAKHAARVEQIMVRRAPLGAVVGSHSAQQCDAMAEVCDHQLPIRCEYALSHRWSKRLHAKFDDSGNLLPCDTPSHPLQ